MKTSGFRGPKASSQLDYIEEQILLLYGEHGKIPMTAANNGFGSIDVDDTVKTLADYNVAGIPANAGCATIMIEAGAGVTAAKKDRCVRFTENDSDPAVDSGFFLGDGDVFEVSGDALNNFSFVSGELTQGSTIWVQFYESVETDQ